MVFDKLRITSYNVCYTKLLRKSVNYKILSARERFFMQQLDKHLTKVAK